MAPLSIALICNSYPPVIGGSEIEAQRVAVELQKRGHRVEILCSGGAPMPALKFWIDPAGVPVRIFGGRLPQPFRGYIYALGVAWTLFRKRRQYDVVYFLMSGLQIATGVPMARWLRKPILMKFSGSSLIRLLSFTALGRLELDFLRRWADRIMVLNPGMFEEAAEARLDAAKLMWMPNPVDTGEFYPLSPQSKTALRRSLQLPADAPVILYVGRLAPEKELASLIRAFARTVPDNPEALLLLVGDGPARPELEALSRTLCLSARVKFTGMVPVADVHKWMQASDVFALVSSLEGLPCSLIEAMSVGLASVVSDIPANLQLVDSANCGLVAPLKNEVEIATCLQRLIKNPELRNQLGREARERVAKTFSTEAVANIYEEMLAQVLGKQK